jgi:hypothetical protein
MGSWAARLTLLLLLLAGSASAGNVSIRAITGNPAQYDHQSVTVLGVATAVAKPTSRAGNPYTTFRVQDADGSSVKVFTFGHPTIKDGDRVEVTGVFEQVKRVRNYTFYNEIDATNVQASPR